MPFELLRCDLFPFAPKRPRADRVGTPFLLVALLFQYFMQQTREGLGWPMRDSVLYKPPPLLCAQLTYFSSVLKISSAPARLHHVHQQLSLNFSEHELYIALGAVSHVVVDKSTTQPTALLELQQHLWLAAPARRVAFGHGPSR